MEQIKKQIYLNPYISRHNSYIPYIVRDVEEAPLIMDGHWIEVSSFSQNGNWGNYPYDIDLNKCEDFIDDNGQTVYPKGLYQYFINSQKIPFRELADKYSLLHDILYKASYYKVIKKNGVLTWVGDEPSLGEKINIKVVDDLSVEELNDGQRIGVYYDNSFAENGGNEMLKFLFRAMGMFIVNKDYVNAENGVPEVMYYAGINSYLESMDKVRDSEECCQNKHFEFLGGNVFYGYLKYKQSSIEDEIRYWHKALCRDTYNNLIKPDINLSLVLNGECFSIGNYMSVPDINVKGDTRTRSIGESMPKEIINESMLKYLRREKFTYYTDLDDNSLELPLILDVYEYEEGSDEVAKQYELTQPYIVGHPKNLNEEDGKYYGDIIYQMDFLKNYVHIFYEIGGRLKKTEDKETKKITWSYYDNPQINKYPVFSEFVKSPKSNLTPEEYLYLKKEFEVEENYNDEILFKNDLNENIPIKFPEENSSEIWIYRIPKKGVYALVGKTEKECFEGDYIIIGENGYPFHFNMGIVDKQRSFTGIRYYERRNWEQHDYTNDYNTSIYMLDDTLLTGKRDILKDTNYVRNADNVEIVNYDKMDDDVTGLFYSNEETNLSSNILLMNDNDFGKIEMYVENTSDIMVDRGFVSAFEMHYKLGEINTMEDMENYGNNFFGF